MAIIGIDWGNVFSMVFVTFCGFGIIPSLMFYFQRFVDVAYWYHSGLFWIAYGAFLKFKEQTSISVTLDRPYTQTQYVYRGFIRDNNWGFLITKLLEVFLSVVEFLLFEPVRYWFGFYAYRRERERAEAVKKGLNPKTYRFREWRIWRTAFKICYNFIIKILIQQFQKKKIVV